MESARQEIELEFGGVTYQVRPEFKTIIRVEATLNQPSRQLGLKCLNYEASVGEIAAIVFAVLQDQPNPPDKERIGDVIVEDGYDDLMIPLGTYLLRAVKGNKVHEKEAAAKKAGENPPQTA